MVIDQVLINLFVGIASGIVASVVVVRFYEEETKPSLEIITENEPAYSSREPACFYHLVVRHVPPPTFPRLSRRPAWSCRATYDVYDKERKKRVIETVQCRWPSSPEPLATIADGRGGFVHIPDISQLYLGRKVDIFYREDQGLDLVLKREGEAECYIFTNECYLEGGFGYRGSRYKLPCGEYQILASVFYESETLKKWFRLENFGTVKNSVKVSAMEE